MLTYYGLPFLRWLDEVALPEAFKVLEDFATYVESWREILEDESTFMEKVA